jgi:prevent-host-death family protein
MKESTAKKVGAYEVKTHLASLLNEVAGGKEIIITRREKPVARLVPIESAPSRKEIFDRIRSLRGSLRLGRNETPKDLINAGRRI